MINQRLNDISSSKKVFDAAKKPYEQALKESGHEHELHFKSDKNKRKPVRKRKNIIWYNPPYNCSVTTNIGQEFLKLLDKHFPRQHKLHKILNRNLVKISYSCTKNMSQMLTAHNSKILQKDTKEVSTACNCRNNSQCPLSGRCKEETIVYQVTITSETQTFPQNYIGVVESDFKSRYYNHKSSFTNTKKKNTTALSSRYHDILDSGEQPNVKWEIVAKCQPYRCGARKCDLCLTEKLEILTKKPYLNKRSELTVKCRHSTKWKLKNVKQK